MNNLKRVTVCMAACLLSIALGSARAQAADFAPFEGGERLVYRLLWPSGIPMGEAVFEVSSQGNELHFQATVEVRLPQYRFNSMFSAVAAREGLCSLQFHQKLEEESRSSEEFMEFDQTAPYQLAVTRLSTAAVHVLKGLARASVFCGSAGRGASASYPGGMRHSVHGELAGHMAVARYYGGGGVMLSSLAVGRSAVADWLRRQTERQPLGSNWTAGKGELRRSHCRLPPASS